VYIEGYAFAMQTCIDQVAQRVISASHPAPGKQLLCVRCYKAVQHAVDATGQIPPHFAHVDSAAVCQLGSLQDTAEAAHGVASGAAAVVPEQWSAAWKKMTQDAVHRGSVVQYHIHDGVVQELGESCFCVVNATGASLFAYTGYSLEGRSVFFCQESWVHTSGRRQTLLHCCDGHVRELCTESPVGVRTSDGILLSVHIARDLDRAHPCYHDMKGMEQVWASDEGETTRVDAVPIRHAVQVMSQNGRDVVDRIHREKFTCFPVDKLTIYNAPPGAGKTTAIKNAVKRWKYKKVLVVVYNKSNQESLMEEMKENFNCSVKTLDALCMAATTKRFGGEQDDDDFDGDDNDRTFIKRHFPKWNVKDKMQYGGGMMSSKIVAHRLTHPKAPCTICKKHRRLSMVTSADSDKHGWDASFTSFPLHTVIKNITTFASRRYICDRDSKLVKIFQRYDVVVADEMQDLTSGQEMRLLLQAECPVVMVGDFNQTIHDFRHTVSPNTCDPNSRCVLPAEPTQVSALPVVEWYHTYRLDRLSVQWLEDMTGKRMQSARSPKEEGCIAWSPLVLRHENTLIICRKNESVITEAIQRALTATVRVVGGARISEMLHAAGKDAKNRGGLSQLALRLKDSQTFSGAVQMLADADISLKELSTGKFMALGTVHQLKGFEYDHVAVHADVFEAATRERQSPDQTDCTERNCLFVALSRHRKSLTVLCDVSCAPNTTKDPSNYSTAAAAPEIFKVHTSALFV